MSLLTRKRLIIALGVIAALILLYTMIGFLGAPWYAKRYLTDYVATELQRELTIDDIRFNPYTLEVESKNISLSEKNNDPVASLGRLYANIDLNEIFNKTIILSSTVLEQPRLDLIIDEQGKLNLDKLLDDLPPKQDEAPEPGINVVFESSQVVQGIVQAIDRSRKNTISSTIEDINLQLSSISTIERKEEGKYKITLGLEREAELNLQGKLSLVPITSNGHFEIVDMSVESLSKWLDQFLPVHELSGQVNIDGDYSLMENDEGTMIIAVNNVATSIKEFSGKDRYSDMTLTLEDLSFDDLTYESAKQQFDLPEISLTNLVLNKDETKKLVSFDSFGLSSIQYNGTDGNITVAGAGIDKLTVSQRKQGDPFLRLENLGFHSINFSLSDNQLAIGSIDLGNNKVSLEIVDGQYIFPSPPARNVAKSDSPDKIANEITEDTDSDAGKSGKSSKFTFTLDELSIAGSRLDIQDKDERSQLMNLASLKLGGLEYNGNENNVNLSALDLGKVVLISRETGEAFLDFESIGMQSIQYALTSQQLNIATIELGKNTLLFDTDSDGHFVLPVILTGKHTARDDVQKSGDKEGTETEFTLTLDELSIAESLIAYREDSSSGTGTVLATIGSASLTDIDFGLSQQKTVIGTLGLTNARLNLDMDESGTVNVGRLFAPATDDVEPAPEKQEPVNPVDFALNTLEVRGFDIQFTDNTQEEVIQHKITNLSLSANNISMAEDSRSELSLSADLDQGGLLSMKGWFVPVSLQAEIHVALDDLDLTLIDPYIRPATNILLGSGIASITGTLNYAPEEGGLTIGNTEAGLSNILINHADSNEKLLSVDIINANGIGFILNPVDIKIGDVLLSGPYANVHIDEQQNLNLLQAFNAGENGDTEKQKDDDGKDSDLKVDVKRIDVEKGNMDFADLSLTPKFSTRIHELKGTTSGLSSDPDRYTSLELDGRVNEFGAAKITGELQPFNYREQSKINMQFSNIDTESLSPYTAKFAGRKIESGSLWLDLDYTIKNSQLDGQNNIVLESLVLGERVESPEAMDLPLDMAISLLQDDDGKIDVDIPISGDLNNPKFEIDAVIQEAVGNLIGGIVSAPFKFIGSLFGVSGEDLQAISFEPGSAVITPPEAENLQTLGMVLKQRPTLMLIINGVYDPEVDRIALAKQSLIDTISQETGEDATPLNYSDPGIQIIIDQLAESRLDAAVLSDLRNTFDADREATDTVENEQTVETGPRDYYEAVFEQLVKQARIDQSVLEALARQRVQSIIAGIRENEAGVTDRLSAGNEVKITESDNKLVNVTLEAGTIK